MVAVSEQRGKVFAIYMAVNGVAMALGQWLILVGDRFGFVPFAMVSILFSFALLPITLTPVQEPQPTEAPKLGLFKLFATRTLDILFVLALCCHGSFLRLAIRMR